ncbi:hypothetical protein KNP414_03850 [Paenibacillus mucilaginosus KNP414]|uniref:Uncharacterized protein n=1 Tax=Paenibacillus mucilaginosus (strain KNP414) TaxID=1036673 RepID=F8F6B5_PAEMK|nr:hypothetical protein KNP414_03850 [Paenibacillus mucilaginosus KNP414]
MWNIKPPHLVFLYLIQVVFYNITRHVLCPIYFNELNIFATMTILLNLL